MDYNNEERKLTINLKEESYNPEMLLEHTDVKSIRLDAYSDTIELPLELAVAGSEEFQKIPKNRACCICPGSGRSDE